MKKHGLWQFHRALHEWEFAGRRLPVRWWGGATCAEAAQKWVDMTACPLGYRGPVSPYRKADRICRCAHRFIRIKKLPRTVGTWNFVCALVARRMGASADGVTLKTRRKMSPLVWGNEFDVPDFEEVGPRLGAEKRLERMRRNRFMREAELLRCGGCGKKRFLATGVLRSEGYFSSEDAYLLGLPRMDYVCGMCAKKLRSLANDAKSAKDALKFVNQVKRKIREKTRNDVCPA